MLRMLSDILSIVRMSIKESINEKSVEYERFVVHLKYMLRRTFEGGCYSEKQDDLFRLLTKEEQPAYGIAKKIRKYMLEKTDKEIPDEEMSYLMFHLSRIRKYGLLN